MNDSDWAAKNRRAMYNMLPRVGNWTAAYKLSQEEARDITVSYVLNNLLTLEKPVTFGSQSIYSSKANGASRPSIGAEWASAATRTIAMARDTPLISMAR